MVFHIFIPIEKLSRWKTINKLQLSELWYLCEIYLKILLNCGNNLICLKSFDHFASSYFTNINKRVKLRKNMGVMIWNGPCVENDERHCRLFEQKIFNFAFLFEFILISKYKMIQAIMAIWWHSMSIEAKVMSQVGKWLPTMIFISRIFVICWVSAMIHPSNSCVCNSRINQKRGQR